MSGNLWKEGRWFAQEQAKETYPPRHPGRREEDRDWKKAAPPWFLLLVVAVLIGALGVVSGAYFTAKNREAQRIEAAILNAPSAYQSRLSERVAANEEAARIQTETNRRMETKMDQLSTVTAQLTVQVKRLTDAVETRRQ